MDIHELENYQLSDAVKFHQALNPVLWNSNEHLEPEVRDALLSMADDFREFLGVPALDIKDITVSGSNSAYNYTPTSDIDLHLVVDISKLKDNEIYAELFNAKKYQYNDLHNFHVGDHDVELYVQQADETHHSQGIYSLVDNEWKRVPSRKFPKIDDMSVQNKYEDLGHRIEAAIADGGIEELTSINEKIGKIRSNGLETTGEFGPENLSFKLLRNNGLIDELRNALNNAVDDEFSIKETTPSILDEIWGFASRSGSSRSRGTIKKKKEKFEPSTRDKLIARRQAAAKGDKDAFRKSYDQLSKEKEVTEVIDEPQEVENIVITIKKFVDYCKDYLKIETVPIIRIKKDPQWSKRNKTFGQYDSLNNLLHISVANRHTVDVLRTLAHELVHRKQTELADLPYDAGTTGSHWENEANAGAGIIMRNFAEQNPSAFVFESSGYIPTAAQANDPRYSMALTKDVRPGAIHKNAKKMGWKTDKLGRPPVMMKKAAKNSTPNKLFNLGLSEDISQPQLDGLETIVDRAFSKVGIDVEFTRHFLQRANDDRNGEPITIKELGQIFAKEYKRWGKPIAQMGPDTQAVMKDLESDINIPFALNWNGKELELVAKTVMRKKNFKTPNQEFRVENKVNEALDNPYPYTLEGPSKIGTWVGKADTPNGPLVMDFDGNESQDDFSIDFSVNRRMGLEGTGDAFRIFATVVAIMNEWISKVGIERVQQFDFNADKEEHDSDGRSKLYDRFAKKLASQLGWSVQKSVTGNGSTDFFSLQNPKLQTNENFADGKKKGKSRPGRVKKSGASCNGTVTQLRKRAKNSSGEKAKMYHWCANMKSGKKK